MGLQTLKSKRLEEADKKGYLNFSLCKKVVGHLIKICYIFKNFIEWQDQEKRITLSKHLLLDQSTNHSNYVSITSQERAFWGKDASVILEGMQIERRSQVLEELIFLSDLKFMWKISRVDRR